MFDSILKFISRLLYGSPDTVTERGLRSGEWPRVRKEHLKSEPNCQWCGTKWALSVHHICPFRDNPKDELNLVNLITLCERPDRHCHLKRGHLGNFRTGINPRIREDCNNHKTKNKEYF